MTRRRKARENPLLGWQVFGEIPKEHIDRATRPLFSKNAPRVYAEKLKTARLDLYVVLVDEDIGSNADTGPGLHAYLSYVGDSSGSSSSDSGPGSCLMGGEGFHAGVVSTGSGSGGLGSSAGSH